MKTENRIYGILAAVFAAAVLAGAALPELFRMQESTYAGFFSIYGRQKFQEQEAAVLPIFGYLAAGRIRTLLFLWMSMYTALGIWFHIIYAVWLGSTAGLLLALFALRQGWQGLLLFFCCTMPQWIFYGLQWKQELQQLVLWQSRREGAAWLYTVTQYRSVVKLLKALAFCLMGCGVEASLGIWSIRIFLKFTSG